MNKKRFANIVLIVLVVILAGAVGYFALRKPTNSSQAENQLPTNSVNKNSTKVIKFIGEVANEQNFEKEIGNNLFFRLEPGGSSWTISVGSKTSKTSAKDVGYESYYN